MEADIETSCSVHASTTNNSRGLEDTYADYVYSELESLVVYAGIHVQYAGYYKMILKRFPYSVYYKIENGCVKVWRILDNRRNPIWIDDQL